MPAGPQQDAYGYQNQNFACKTRVVTQTGVHAGVDASLLTCPPSLATFDTDSSDKSRYGVAPSRPPSRIDARDHQEGVNLAEAAEMSAEPPCEQLPMDLILLASSLRKARHSK